MFEEELPLASLKKITLNNNQLLNVQIQKCKARLVNGVNPTQNNAWVYRTQAATKGVLNNYLGPIIEVKSGQPCRINWKNTLTAGGGHHPGHAIETQELPPCNIGMSRPGMDESKMNPPVGVITHLHGAKVESGSDGWPLNPIGYEGNPHGLDNNRTDTYANDQRAAMLWFHDHAMDHTATNVYAGLAGLYFIRDQSDVDLFRILEGGYEIPLVIQDRILNSKATAFDYDRGLPPIIPTNLEDRRPEFLGNTIFVNGRQQPHCHLKRRVYRLRLLNGSNARTYALALQNPQDGQWHTDRLTVIGTDGGLMAASRQLAQYGYLVMAPGERRDVLLDLTELNGVNHLKLVNLAIASLVDPNRVEAEAIYINAENSVLVQGHRNVHMQQPLANIMEIRLMGSTFRKHADFSANVDHILQDYADDDDFVCDVQDDKQCSLQPKGDIVKNRLVLLMNNTLSIQGETAVLPKITWSDVQLWEMAEANNNGEQDWPLPFNIDLSSDHPVPINMGQAKAYKIARSSFLKPRDPMHDHLYPEEESPTIEPIAGTYERWYVANIGNEAIDQPLSFPDMHPFHMHLVSFVVNQRWHKDSDGQFVKTTPKQIFDGIARQDTVRVHANELLELIVYYPPGYTGKYVYHCHLVEHEDMGMMMHFNVT